MSDVNVTLVVRSCLPGYSLMIGGDGLDTCMCVGANNNPSAVIACNPDSETMKLRVSTIVH